jgi:hypothetical protein
MARKPNRGIAADPDMPEWTAEGFARARPASEVDEFLAAQGVEMIAPNFGDYAAPEMGTCLVQQFWGLNTDLSTEPSCISFESEE